MRLILALVVDRTADGCRIRIPGESSIREAGWTEPFRSRSASVGPGCLIALDVAVDPPLVAWRCPATVLAVEADRVRLDEPFHGVIETALVVPAPAVGDTVFVTTGLSEGWRIDAGADDPERAAITLPQIVELYGQM